MTCIIGWTEKNNVWLGSDSAVTGGDQLSILNEKKVFKNNKMIFGSAGYIRVNQLFRYSLKIPDQSKKKDDLEYICTDFVDAVEDMLEKKKYAEISNNKFKVTDAFLIGYKGNLYKLSGNLQIISTTLNYQTIGSGGEYARGSLHSLSKYKMKPEDRITKALEAAAEFSAGVRPPFTIIKL